MNSARNTKKFLQEKENTMKGREMKNQERIMENTPQD